MSIYKRLVPADYCNEQDLPRCDAEGEELPHERQISLEMKKQAPVKVRFQKILMFSISF